MAIKPETQYPGQTTPSSSAYPLGSAVNVTSPGSGNGTPLEEAWVNDDWGFKQGLLDAAGVTATGNPDTALISQYLESLLLLSQASSGLIILSNHIATPLTHLEANPGVVLDSTKLLALNNTANFVKRSDAAWVAGDGNGGLPATVSLPTNDWLHFFIIRSSTGLIDFGWDDQLDASKLLSASAYTHYKRLGSTFFDGSSQIKSFTQIGKDIYFSILVVDLDVLTLPTTEVALTLTVPKDVTVIAKLMTYMFVTPASPEGTSTLLLRNGYGGLYFEANNIFRNISFDSNTSGYVEVWSDTNSEIKYSRSTSIDSSRVQILTLGYSEYF